MLSGVQVSDQRYIVNLQPEGPRLAVRQRYTQVPNLTQVYVVLHVLHPTQGGEEELGEWYLKTCDRLCFNLLKILNKFY